jgi:hypothetical protein
VRLAGAIAEEDEMGVRRLSLIGIVLILSAPLWGKSKEEKTLPVYVLTARTVAVIVDPQAGVDAEDPRANQVAQKDVETALANWGRFEMVMRPELADLVIVVRKGHGRLVDETIPDSRQNSRAGVINPTNNGIQVGAQHGSPNPGSAPGNGPDESPAPNTAQVPMPQQQGPQMEVGGVEDSFVVYQGGRSGEMLGAAAWRKDEKNGLRSHNVPVVDEFRKAVAEADKAAGAKKP